jgi:formate hydrogenlyase subunit 6/NADH:ubiquinone oxidoreductase subunit I
MESCFANNGCVSCVDACPYEALRSDGNHIKVSSLSCVECGLCAVACPEYEIQMPTFLEQTQQILIDVLADSLKKNDATVLFTCKYGFKMLQHSRKKMDRDFIPIMIPCIASFSHVALARARSRGLKIQLLCPEKKCEMRKGAEEYARLSAATFPDLTEVAITDGLDLDELGRQQAKYDYDDVNFGSGKRKVLSSILAKYGDKQSITKCEGLPFFSVELDQETCTMCEACAIRCVPEALTIVKNHGKASLEFEHSKCTGCMVCEDVCRPDSIKVVRELNFKSINKKIMLKEEADSTCIVCGEGLRVSSETLKDERQVEGSTVIQSDEYCESCAMKLIAGKSVEN